MRPIENFANILSDNELEQLHDQVVQLLADPGFRMDNEEVLTALNRKGAKVDFSSKIVKFPPSLLEETIEIAAREENERKKAGGSELDTVNALTFSWHTPMMNQASPVQSSFGGGCPSYYDHEKKEIRYATAQDYVRMVHLAEGLPEVKTTGNAVHYLREENGSFVPPYMVAIKGAALVAKHSSKPGCTSIIDKRQLEFLMDIGIIVKDSPEEYIKQPIFVNIHDTETPLRMSRSESAIMVEMAKRKISTFILPMPLAGIVGPVYPIANAIIGAAEILAVWTAAKSIREDAPVEAACVSGIMNPANATASFSAPEAVLIDVAVAQLFRRRYRTRCGVGPGFIDATIPGSRSIYERSLKCYLSALSGEPSFPAGILAAGIVFSPEQVMLDLDIVGAQNQYVRGIGGEHFKDSLELIRERGIGGLFIDTEHTAFNFKDNIWIPHIFKRLKETDIQVALQNDPVEKAHQEWKAILNRTEMYRIDEDRGKDIDIVVARAEEALS